MKRNQSLILIAENSITSRELAANTIATANIADNAVDGTKIASNSILTRHIDDNQINIDQLNVSDGSSGQALTTNGSGTLAFSTISGADNLLVVGRSANVTCPLTAGSLTVVARSGNVSVGVT